MSERIGERLLECVVIEDWIDYNGHMNDAAYALVFSRAGDAFMDDVGLDAATRKATGWTLYTAQVMLHYFKEAKLGAPLSVRARVLEFDEKRVRMWMEMFEGEARLAATEQLMLSVAAGVSGARVAPWRKKTLEALARLAAAEVGCEPPELAGRGIILKRT